MNASQGFIVGLGPEVKAISVEQDGCGTDSDYDEPEVRVLARQPDLHTGLDKFDGREQLAAIFWLTDHPESASVFTDAARPTCRRANNGWWRAIAGVGSA
jgi:hypothetical protein